MYNKFEQEKNVNKDRQTEIDHILKVKKISSWKIPFTKINYISVLARKLNTILFKAKQQKKFCLERCQENRTWTENYFKGRHYS